MQNKTAHTFFIVFFLIYIHSNVFCATVIKGDNNAASGESFSFQVQEHVQNRSETSDMLSRIFPGANFYVGAAPNEGGAGKVKNFALSRLIRDQDSFIPLTPEKASVNRVADQPNPLFDQGIAFLTLLEGNLLVPGAHDRPVIVLQSDLKTLYVLNDFTIKNAEVISTTTAIHDANENDTEGIVGIEGAGPLTLIGVKANGGDFGDPGSGINVAKLGFVEVKKNPKGKDTEENLFRVAAFSTNDQAVSLDRTSTAVKIGNDIASIDNLIDIHWDAKLERFFVALRVQAGAAGTDGARAVVTGRIETIKKNNLEITKLILSSIAPDSVFDGAQNKIIGAQGANAQISIHKVRTMMTSTALPYLIVLGGNGSPGTTRRTIFALPLVSNNTKELNGTIANKNIEPEDCFSTASPPKFVTRKITEPATEPAQMTTNNDAAAQVGCGALPNGDITDIFVSTDTVFATVQTPDGNQIPGIFYSQALFDVQGKIKGWTMWRRAAGTTDKVLGGNLDPIRGNFTFLAANSANEVKTVKSTDWSGGDGNTGLGFLTRRIVNALPQQNAGVQGLCNFPLGTPALQNISLLIATGLNAIVLAETGSIIGGAFVPNIGGSFDAIEEFDNGTITKTFPVMNTKVVSITGGVLNDLGPVVTSAIARNGNPGTNGWLFVGGVGGVAVLSKEDGTGWDPTTQLATGFAGLTNGMSFKQIGNYQFVRKVVADDNFLYVLTDTTLDRIDLSKGNPGLGSIVTHTIAQTGIVPGTDSRSTFLDFIVSEKLGLLGTNAGLLRIGNDRDIRTVTNIDGAAWTLVPTFEGIGPIRQLFAISTTGIIQDFAKNDGGLVYALDAYRGANQSRSHRFVISNVEGTAITNNTVQPIPDLFVKDITSYFVSYGSFRNLFATDGALYLSTRGRDLNQNPMLTVLHASGSIHGGVRFLGSNSLVIPINFASGSIIASMIQNFASGSWIIAGDFGLRINE